MGDIGSFMAGKHLVQFHARNKHGAVQAATAVAAAMTPVSGMGGGAAPAAAPERAISPDLINDLREDPFLKKCYGSGKDMDTFISQLSKIYKGDKSLLSKSFTRDYGREVFDLDDFFSRNFPKNANNTSIPAKTAKLIARISPSYELLIMGTGDDNGDGVEDVIMTLMG